jgi:hypothetical protein
MHQKSEFIIEKIPTTNAMGKNMENQLEIERIAGQSHLEFNQARRSDRRVRFTHPFIQCKTFVIGMGHY